MEKQPQLGTKRLLLRPMTLADAPDVQRLAGDKAIYDTTLTIPHPYGDGVAEAWISTHAAGFEEGKEVHFGVTLDEAFIGLVGLTITPKHFCAELAYWIGKPYWGQGYCTEAARAVLEYGFRTLGLHRVYAIHFRHNPASGRVMQKLGMTHEGCLREHRVKDGVFIDLEQYGILRDEFGGDG